MSDFARTPCGLEVFLIETGHCTLALLAYEVPAGARMPRLTDAERAVMLALVEGQSNAQIAAGRKTAARTVANQVASLRAKFHVCSRAELVVRWTMLHQRSGVHPKQQP